MRLAEPRTATTRPRPDYPWNSKGRSRPPGTGFQANLREYRLQLRQKHLPSDRAASRQECCLVRCKFPIDRPRVNCGFARRLQKLVTQWHRLPSLRKMRSFGRLIIRISVHQDRINFAYKVSPKANCSNKSIHPVWLDDKDTGGPKIHLSATFREHAPSNGLYATSLVGIVQRHCTVCRM